jgi:hypothetical protein
MLNTLPPSIAPALSVLSAFQVCSESSLPSAQPIRSAENSKRVTFIPPAPPHLFLRNKSYHQSCLVPLYRVASRLHPAGAKGQMRSSFGEDLVGSALSGATAGSAVEGSGVGHSFFFRYEERMPHLATHRSFLFCDIIQIVRQLPLFFPGASRNDHNRFDRQ